MNVLPNLKLTISKTQDGRHDYLQIVNDQFTLYTKIADKIEVDDRRQPDAWDHETILRENQIHVKLDCIGWGFTWQEEFIHIGETIGETTEDTAHKAAAMYVALRRHGVPANFADQLMDGYILLRKRLQ